MVLHFCGISIPFYEVGKRFHAFWGGHPKFWVWGWLAIPSTIWEESATLKNSYFWDCLIIPKQFFGVVSISNRVRRSPTTLIGRFGMVRPHHRLPTPQTVFGTTIHTFFYFSLFLGFFKFLMT